jgi:hypothetical protein
MALTCRWRSRPQHQKRPHAVQQTRTSFNHLVGAAEQRRRHFEARRLGAFEINRQLILGRCLDRKVGRFLALEDAVDVAGRAPVLVDQNGSIGDQAANKSPRSPREIIELHLALASDFDRAASFELKRLAQRALGIFGHLYLASAAV